MSRRPRNAEDVRLAGEVADHGVRPGVSKAFGSFGYCPHEVCEADLMNGRPHRPGCPDYSAEAEAEFERAEAARAAAYAEELAGRRAALREAVPVRRRRRA